MPACLAKTMAAASGGQFGLAADLARELAGPGESTDLD
jgi:hypothetical protein